MGSVEHMITLIKQKEWKGVIEFISSVPSSTDQQINQIFEEINALERVALYKEIIRCGYNNNNGKYDLKFFMLLKPSEQGIVLEDLSGEDISTMLKGVPEQQRFDLLEVLPYSIMEKVDPFLTEQEKAAIRSLEEGSSSPPTQEKKSCAIS